MKHAGSNCPVGHAFHAPKAERANDATATANEEQLTRIIQVNGFRVRIDRVKCFSKQVFLSGPDADRAMRVLGRCGWTKI
jgi:hypothetical protein